jgi:hypothetical protein
VTTGKTIRFLHEASGLWWVGFGSRAWANMRMRSVGRVASIGSSAPSIRWILQRDSAGLA